MQFSVYQPPQATHGKVPALYYLAGLSCSDETFMIKAGAQRLAAELGLMLVCCDTSPRGLDLPGDAEHWDFGVGAGFYVDATQAPWSGERKSVVSGKSVSVRVDLGGRRIIKKTNYRHQIVQSTHQKQN